MSIIQIVVLIFLSILIAWLLHLLTRKVGGQKKEKLEKPTAPREGKIHPCPICGTLLKSHEKVHSVVYPGENDRLVEVFGCPYCYPANDDYPRTCPVCKEIIPPDGFLIGRMFYSGEKPHMHINGCTRCRKRH